MGTTVVTFTRGASDTEVWGTARGYGVVKIDTDTVDENDMQSVIDDHFPGLTVLDTYEIDSETLNVRCTADTEN